MADAGFAAAGRVDRIEVLEHDRPAWDGLSFGAVGPYQRLVGRLYCSLDPAHPLNRGIVDLDLAPRDAAGRVAYASDFMLLHPADLARGNGWLLFEVANRGTKRTNLKLNNAPPGDRLARPEEIGTGHLMRQGYSLLWTAWQGDVPPGGDRLQASFPTIPGITGLSRDEIIADAPGTVRDEYLQDLPPDRFIATLSYPAASLDQGRSSLTVRQRERDPREPLASWRFLDDRHIEVTRGDPARFDRGAIYEFIYPARDPVVMGLGFAAIRDSVSFFRWGAADAAGTTNPLSPGGRPGIRHALGIGISQSGRVLRDWLYQGFNQAGDGRAVFDGMMPIIAGARRTFVNARFAQAGRYPRQHEDHSYPDDQFPFAYAPMHDPISGRTDGMLEPARAAGVCPRIMHVDTDSEMWSARASLLVTDTGGNDIDQPPEVRVYLTGGLPHGGMHPPAAGVTQHPANPLSYGPAVRALLPALLRWVETGEEPPPSLFPSRKAGTLVTLEEARAAFPAVPGTSFPPALNGLRLMDYGTLPATEGSAYPVFVAKTDGDGNPVDGWLHPMIRAPLAAHTGWNPRGKGYAEGELYSIAGSMLRFAEAPGSGDPRPSIQERYGDRAGWLRRLEQVCTGMAAAGWLLQEDADRLVAAARAGQDPFSVL